MTGKICNSVGPICIWRAWKESTGSDFLPATLEDVPREFGVSFKKTHLNLGHLCPFGILPEDEVEDFVVLSWDLCSPSHRPSDYIFPVLRRNWFCLVFVPFALLSVILGLLGASIMGQTMATPLTLTLQHWKDVQDTAADQGMRVKKKKWITFCSAEWLTFDVGWPRDGTFDLNVILQVKKGEPW